MSEVRTIIDAAVVDTTMSARMNHEESDEIGLTNQFRPVTYSDHVRVEKDIEPDQNGRDQRCHSVAQKLYRQYRAHANDQHGRGQHVEATGTYEDVGE